VDLKVLSEKWQKPMKLPAALFMLIIKVDIKEWTGSPGNPWTKMTIEEVTKKILVVREVDNEESSRR
jgi:hypothetical protein